MATRPQHQTAPARVLSTPRKATRMTQRGAATLDLDEQRLHLKESSGGNTVQIPAESFLAHYANLLPSRQDTDALVSHVVTELTAEKVLNRKTGWTATNFVGPTEDAVFKGLGGVAEKIHDSCVEWNKEKQHPKLQQRTTRLICRPNHTTASEVRGGSMKTDARFVLQEIDSDTEVPTSAAVSVAEFKTRRTRKNRIDNESKVLGAVGHIFYNDPCRRFVIAFTIEDSWMRFWYLARSHIAISDQFNYHQNPRLFIRFVIFMTFAPLEDLGYDPTVKRVGVSEKDIQYRFTVGDKVYLTTGIIHDSNLDLVTRATRVWEVIELDSEDRPTGTPKVLKDVWLYFDATPESDIYEAIFKALRKLDEDGNVPETERPPPVQPGSSLAEDAKNYFMTILSDSVVTINGQPDEAQEPPADYVELFYTEAEDKVAMEATVAGTNRGEVDGCTPKLKRADRAVYPHTKRIHRRIVFEEVCRTLYKVLSYADFTKGLAQLVYGLAYMRLAGFVHRDISPGNVLIHNGRTKISDLEYARVYAAPGHGAAPLTGTPGFMAVEYQVQEHLFEPPGPGMTESDSEDSEDSWFKFNFLHDLEAVLWIYLWFLLETLPAKFTQAEREGHRNIILSFNEMLLDGSLRCSSDRLLFLEAFKKKKRPRYNEIISALKAVHGADSVLPTALKSFGCLVRHYKAVESSEPLHPESPDMTHWDPKVFLHAYYQDIYCYFTHVYEQMEDTKEEALWIWYTDQEDAHRAQQAAGPLQHFSVSNRPSKRPRTGTQWDSEAYVPPIQEDENQEEQEEEDGDPGGPPSPTEDSQVRKRKRAGLR